MAKTKKPSLFERLTGGIRMTEEENPEATRLAVKGEAAADGPDPWATDEETEGELALDVYQTATDIIVHTFVAGVRPEDLEINITRDMLTIRGKRQENRVVSENDFFSRELYWGTFSRTVSLPQEVDPEEAEAIERHGLLTIRLPKIDRTKRSNVKVKSV